MSLLVTVDPAVHHLGFGVFRDARLVKARLLQPENKKLEGPEAWAALAEIFDDEVVQLGAAGAEFVLEFPKVYQGGKAGGDPADMMELAAVDGAIVGVLLRFAAKVTRVYPSDWKEQMTKEVTTPRILERLSEAEKACIELAGAKSHNIYDSIGIGLHHLGRFERKRVYPR